MVQMAVTWLLVCALAVAVVRGVPNTSGDLLPQVYETVQRIAEYVRKEDQINKLAQRMDDLDQKMLKMTNVITSLYEMNKEMGTKGFGAPPATAADLDQLERNLKEQMSVVSMETRRELSTLKQVTYAITERCDSRSPEDDSRQKSLGPEVADALLNSTREIKEQLLTIGDMLAAIKKTGDCDSAPSTEQPVDRSPPTSCASLQKGAGAFSDGVYDIFIRSTQAVRVYCDMATDGGGWTVIMRRGDFGPKQISFNQNWNGYKEGFGDVEGEFWLGNDNIHALTSQENNTLQVRLESFGGRSLVLNYDYFAVEGEHENYRMRLGWPIERHSPAYFVLREHDNMPFSTYDRKSEFEAKCDSRYKGGWWFNRWCFHVFLTGEYFGPEEPWHGKGGIYWSDFTEEYLKSAEMLIRPTNTN